MFLMVLVLFIIVPLLYIIYGLLGRKLTISEIDKKAVLITGCGSGFGRDLVKRCLQHGLTVFAGCQFESNINELEESYKSISQSQLYAFQMDVTDHESVQKSKEIVNRILKEKNLVLHALVNNAGIQGHLFYDDFLTLDDYKEVWDVNIYGVIRVTQTFRDLIKKSRGRIVICSSATTLFPAPSNGPYSSSKFAVQAYCIIMRHELQPFGVDVIEIIPGCFKTGMQNAQLFKKSIDTLWYRASQEMHDDYGHDYNEKAKAFRENIGSLIAMEDKTWVIDAYYEAIIAKRPKLLYRVGWDVFFKFYPYSCLPLHLQLYVMKFMMYLVGAPLPAVATKILRPQNRKSKET